MREQDITFISQQTLIACRAFFPDSENTFSGVLCCKDGQPVVFVELNYEWDGSITYDVWFYLNHSKTVYSVSYDQMCSRLKYLSRIISTGT